MSYLTKLELSVPPVAFAVLIAVGMWSISALTSPIALAAWVRLPFCIAFIATGTWVSLIAVGAFRQAKTTVNPTKPHSTSALVCTGIYRYTRNPMYLGFLLILCGLAILLASPLALFGPAIFVIYMNRFQIIPEERMLATRFGEEFLRYKASVRRWC